MVSYAASLHMALKDLLRHQPVLVESQLTNCNNAMLVGWGMSGVFKEVHTPWAEVGAPLDPEYVELNPAIAFAHA